MLVKVIARISDVNFHEGTTYVTGIDTEQGGMFKISIPGSTQIKLDDLVNIDATVKPGLSARGLYLRVETLHTEESKTKGDK